MFVFVNIRKWLENNATCELNFSNIENEVYVWHIEYYCMNGQKSPQKGIGLFCLSTNTYCQAIITQVKSGQIGGDQYDRIL